MANGPKNIVQAEFFHANVDADTLEELCSSMGRRIEAGEPLKSAVRFFDEQGQVARLVQNFAISETVLTRAIADLGMVSMESHEIASLEADVSNAARRISRLRGQARSLVIGQLAAVMKGSKHLAVEHVDGSFRPVEESEYEQLLASVKSAKDFGLSIFEPADLLKGDLVLLGSMPLPL